MSRSTSTDGAKPKVLLIGFLDTKEAEYAFVKDLLEAKGCEVVIIDTSIQTETALSKHAAHPPSAVCSAAGTSLSHLRTLPRVAALEHMTTGATALALTHQQDSLHGALAMGGSTTTALACAVLRALRVGLPKLCVSTMASGDVSHYVGDSDICMMPSIADISGSMNVLSARILTNAAAALTGMAHAYKDQPTPASGDAKHMVAVTMFGLTTPGVTVACERLRSFTDASGRRLYEPVVFHCTGAGGRTMERLVEEKWFHAVLDLTTTELADEQCGGILSAGPTRLTAPGNAGIPHVVSLGALDMCNFGPRSTVPEKYVARTLHEHNPSITLLRTSAEECAAIGCTMADRLSVGHGPLAVVIPKHGWSGIDIAGGPFWDPDADRALVEELKKGLKEKGRAVEVIEVDKHVNDRDAAWVMADKLHELVEKWERSGGGA
ncbi:UPF0261 domain protein [Gloeophyllum trabeum ATCC 11539]|uniref:UPF0261 domain protein n=1 Tax=Gloeophyllum trabeum (strain ATCC 11539 / FP-39264 / Madison 617) TaxID=670483 RepID=S7Q2M2_GLOTA|nr:UPF0261 domain protein [Gloeophyllum trabeum ATCC 11539]EPQ53802.1 UPF0261 domain protein [Gloeophyllum trabeum ATCC 11539]